PAPRGLAVTVKWLHGLSPFCGHGLYVKKFLPWLAFPTWVCDCEGVARFPWASSPVTGSYTRATGWLGHFSGWPSAVCAFFPPFAAQPWWGGACQGWGAAPAAAQ